MMDDSHLPIDIQLKKLLDWLISRRICNRQWHEKIVEIREKIGHAIGDMPEHEAIKKLLSGTNIQYFHCVQIVDILKETEKDSKNFFGSYGSQRMKDWQEVTNLYQRDTIYLAEAAQLLSQAVTYELPGLKKALAKSVTTQEECDMKEKDNNKKAAEFRREFEKSCQQLGIEGNKIRREIIALMKDLPDTYADIATKSKELKEAREMYCGFLERTLDEGICSREDTLPALDFLIRRGNVTTYEYMHGEAPLSVEEPELDFGDDDEDANADQGEEATIDFGDDAGGAIDFGDDDVELDSGADIDWGNLDAAGGDGGEIDWGAGAAIEAEDATAAGIIIEDGGVSGGVARDSEALTLLDNRRTRTAILDELAELQYFLEQRLVEQQAAEEGRFTVGGADVAKNENTDTTRVMIANIAALTTTLSAGKIHHLQLIRSSPKYVDRMVEGLRTKLSLVERMRVGNKVVGERRDAAIKEQALCQRKLLLVKAKTGELQKDIERDISKRYKGRPVNIMGGVQSL